MTTVVVILMLSSANGLATLYEALEGRGGRLGKLVQHGLATLQHSRDCFEPKVFAVGLLLGILAWSANAASFYYIAHLVGTHISFPIALFIYSFAVLVGGLSFLPGGVGTAEAAMIALLILHGMPEGQAVAVTLVHRSVTLWFSVLLGICSYYWQGRDAVHRSHPSDGGS